MPTASARNSVRPNAARRFAYRVALLNRPCAACLLPAAFDGAQGADILPGSAVLMHTEDVRDCKEYSTRVIVKGCDTCNEDARIAGVRDITADVVSEPYTLPAQKIVNAMRAVWVNESAANLPGAEARRAARRARGLTW